MEICSKLYQKPFNHVGPFSIGILLGYSIRKHRKIRISKVSSSVTSVRLLGVEQQVNAWFRFTQRFPRNGFSKNILHVLQLLQLVLWSATLISCSAVLFAAYPWNNELPSLPVATVYAATHRVVWSAGIAWLIFACVTGRGGNAFINLFQSDSQLCSIFQLNKRENHSILSSAVMENSRFRDL